MKTVLKKAGIIVAAAAAGLLAVSPLAFAGEYEGESEGHHGHHEHHEQGVRCDQDNRVKNNSDSDADRALIEVNHLTVQVPVQLCGNKVVSGVLGVIAKDQYNEDDQ
ncbi:MAG: hypothetical protein JO100_09435 [Pseudonocardia sp.]|nr:hypothetical protein [Pseudonocardia sp.]